MQHVGSSSLTRGQTWAPCIGSAESQPLDAQASPLLKTFWCFLFHVLTPGSDFHQHRCFGMKLRVPDPSITLKKPKKPSSSFLVQLLLLTSTENRFARSNLAAKAGISPRWSCPQGTWGHVWGRLWPSRLGGYWHQGGGASKAVPHPAAPRTVLRRCSSPCPQCPGDPELEDGWREAVSYQLLTIGRTRLVRRPPVTRSDLSLLLTKVSPSPRIPLRMLSAQPPLQEGSHGRLQVPCPHPHLRPFPHE